MFNELLKRRRSVRSYLEKPVEPEKIEYLLEAALRSPTGHNCRCWHFIVVDEQAELEKLSTAKPQGASMLKSAAAAIVVCVETEKSLTWIEDLSIASSNIQLAAVDTGLGTCWVQIRGRSCDETMTAEEYVKKQLEIPEEFNVLSIIAIGYPATQKTGPEREKLLWDRISFGTFGKSR